MPAAAPGHDGDVVDGSAPGEHEVRIESDLQEIRMGQGQALELFDGDVLCVVDEFLHFAASSEMRFHPSRS